MTSSFERLHTGEVDDIRAIFSAMGMLFVALSWVLGDLRDWVESGLVIIAEAGISCIINTCLLAHGFVLVYLKKPLIAVYRWRLLWMVKCEQNCLVGSGGDFKEEGKNPYSQLCMVRLEVNYNALQKFSRLQFTISKWWVHCTFEERLMQVLETLFQYVLTPNSNVVAQSLLLSSKLWSSTNPPVSVLHNCY